jgi:manganese/iron transport system permease protein
MIEDLYTLARTFPAAIAAGFVISSVCALLGVFVILKRVVFIGITLSQAAACGIAAAMVYHLHPFVGACTLTLATVGVLAYPFETNRLPRDAVLGVIFVLTSGLSILLVAKSGFGLNEIRALLYGDLILTNDRDLTIVLATLLPVAAYLLAFLRPTVYTFLDREAARVLGLRVALWELLYFFALGLAVSAASRVAGALLVFCYLVVAPSAALLLSRRLRLVMLLAVAVAVLSTGIGMYWSFAHDLPTNQSIAVISCGVFCFAVMVRGACLAASAAGRPSRTPVGQAESPR